MLWALFDSKDMRLSNRNRNDSGTPSVSVSGKVFVNKLCPNFWQSFKRLFLRDLKLPRRKFVLLLLQLFTNMLILMKTRIWEDPS